MNKTKYFLSLLCVSAIAVTAGTASAQEKKETNDSTDIFYQHLQLGEVVITGLAGDTKVKEMPSPVSVVRPADLRSRAATNIIGALAQEPGIQQITTGPSISKPVIRGLGYNRVLVVHDGIRQEGQQWGDEHGVEIDGSDIHYAEVFKGPASLMYGSDALSGVIIFHPQPQAPFGTVNSSVSSEYQSNSKLFGYSVSNSGNLDGLVWNARFSDRYSGAYRNKYDGKVPNSGFMERAASAMVGKNGSWGYTRLKASWYHLRPGIIEGERNAQTGELEGDDFGHKPSLPFQQIYHYKVVSDNTFRVGDGEIKAIIGWQQNRRQEFEESPDECNLYMKLNTVNYDLRYQSGNADGWKLAAGISGMYQNNKNLGEESLIPNYNLLDAGAFVTATKSAGEWIISGGLRADLRHLDSKAMEDHFTAFKRDFKGFSGSIGAVRPLGEHFTFKANIAHGFRAPNLSELGSDGEHEGTFRYEVGNHGLSPEKSLQGDLSLDFSSNYVSFQTALFASRIDNYIYLTRNGRLSDEGVPVYTYIAGRATLKGLEASVDFHPVHSLHLSSAFSCVYAKEKSGNNLPMTPAPRLFSEAKYELSHDGKFFNNCFVAIDMDYNFRQDRIFAINDTETPTPAYALLGASAGTDIVINGKTVACLHFIASNLTDKAYQSHLSRLKYADVNTRTGRTGVFNPGRNFTVKLTLYL